MSERSFPREAVLALPPAALRRKVQPKPPVKRLLLPVIVPDPNHRGPNPYLAAMPSWLVSFVLHLIVVLGLAAVKQCELPGRETKVVLVVDMPQAVEREVLAMVPNALATQTIESPAEDEGQPTALGDDSRLLQLPLNVEDVVITDDVILPDKIEPFTPLDIGELHSIEIAPRKPVPVAGGPVPVQPAAKFCGVEATGESFVFLIDCSSSMEGARLNEAKRQVREAVGHLQPPQRFYVFFFSDHALPMFGSTDEASAPIVASKENIARLDAWLNTVKADGGTEPADAADLALDMHPDAIYLLSDGELGSTRIHDIIAAKNQAQHAPDFTGKGARRIAIHTIGFYSLNNQATLTKIAAQCGGTYRYVADPQPPPAPKAKKPARRPARRPPQQGLSGMAW